MIIKSLKIKNFRSFGEASSLLKFGDGINVIVGENNVGKSNVLRALELITKRREVASDDYHKGESDREILVTATVEFDRNVMREFAKRLLINEDKNIIQQAIKELGNAIDIEFSSKSNDVITRFRGFWVRGQNFYSLEDDGRGPHRKTSWKRVLDQYLSPDNTETLAELVKRFTQGKPPRTITHSNPNLSNLFFSRFFDKTKIFAEIRQRPSGSNQHVFESLDGTQLADVLFNLKNGGRTKRRKWEEIRRKFAELFPNLKLDVTKVPPTDPPKITIEKEAIEHEVPISFSGSAIGEILILLTHLIYFEKMCFGIDMPELHLHPHAKRLLRDLLKEKSESNQFFVVTHSSTYIDPRRLENVLVVRERDGLTVIKQLNKAPDPKERERLRRHLDENMRDFFFSRAVLIVEGETEKGALPIFSKILEKDFDQNGISVIEGGSQFCRIFIKILKDFDFPYLVMHDKDALMYVLKHIERDGKSIETSSVFYNVNQLLAQDDFEILERMVSKIENIGERRQRKVYPDDVFEELKDLALKYDVYVLPTKFEGILKRDGYEKFLKEARKISTRKKSKVICGRYVAEKIAENELPVPKEFRDVVGRIVEKASL